MKDYIKINKDSWNARLNSHLTSDFYNMKAFMRGESTLNSLELSLLGDIRGKRILHLQCHFGQDTISLSKLGAIVTGVDLSDLAISKAKKLANELGVDTEFVCCDIYDLPKYLSESFDIVFTSYGVILWLPDLDRWAKIVKQYLKPKGMFVFVEFHPVIWMYDESFSKVAYYYNNVEPIIEIEEGTYADKEADIQHQFVCWNHGLGEVVNSLISNDVFIQSLVEYDYSPYPIFDKLNEEFSPGKYRIKSFGNKMPLVYSLVATKLD